MTDDALIDSPDRDLRDRGQFVELRRGNEERLVWDCLYSGVLERLTFTISLPSYRCLQGE